MHILWANRINRTTITDPSYGILCPYKHTNIQGQKSDIILEEMGTTVLETDGCGPGWPKDRVAPSISRQFERVPHNNRREKNGPKTARRRRSPGRWHILGFMIPWCKVFYFIPNGAVWLLQRGTGHPPCHSLLYDARDLFDIFCDGFDLDALAVASIASGLIIPMLINSGGNEDV